MHKHTPQDILKATVTTLNPEVLLDEFLRIKHTRIEGLIIEREFTNLFISELIKKGWVFIDTLIVRRWRKDFGTEFLMLKNDIIEDKFFNLLKVYLKRTGLVIREVEIDDHGELFVYQDKDGKILPKPIKIPFHYSENTSNSAIDPARINAIFWGYLWQQKEQLLEWAKHILIKDYYFSFGAKAIWDLDFFLISPHNELFYIELKHKYPMPNYTFGLNAGEKMQSDLLKRAGIKTFHVILTKPIWDKDVSSMYLFYDRQARENAMWVGADLSDESIFSANVKSAGNHTSIYGASRVKFHSLPIDKFYLIGKNSEEVGKLSDSFYDLINYRQRNLLALTVELLEKARLR